MKPNLSSVSESLRRLNPEVFGGPAVASPEPSKGTEADLHLKILAECRRRGWIALHGSMAHRTHRTIGEPDFVIMADAGRVLFVEAKVKGGKVSPEQQAFKAWAEKLGHTVNIVWSFDEFLKLTECREVEL